MYRWMAIEGATNGRFSTASDVWSFAVFLHELFTKGERPYAGTQLKLPVLSPLFVVCELM